MKTIRQRFDEKVRAMDPALRAAGREAALIEAVDDFFAEQYGGAAIAREIREHWGKLSPVAEPFPTPFPDLPPLPLVEPVVPGLTTTTTSELVVTVQGNTAGLDITRPAPARAPRSRAPKDPK